jgi:hypothetical protein
MSDIMIKHRMQKVETKSDAFLFNLAETAGKGVAWTLTVIAILLVLELNDARKRERESHSALTAEEN